MNICESCKSKIPTWCEIDGKKRNLNKRKYCLKCSPFGIHNTKKLNGSPRKDQRPHKCKCGETDPNKFYGNKRTTCSNCHNTYTQELYLKKKYQAIEYKGGSCSICGYKKYYAALEFHHVNPEEKEQNFVNMRHWKWERIKTEIDKCILLCSNCHREVHGNVTLIPKKQ